MSKNKFTTHDAAFVRSHGRTPRGRGGWLFQRTTGETCFDRELHGEMVNQNGTFAEAVRAMRAAGHTGDWAVMP